MTNWNPPPYDPQVFNGVDIDDCAEEALCHIAFSLTGKRYSPRALASVMYARGLLTDNGSKADDAIAVANEVGLVPYELWPTPASFTKAEYLTPVPPEIQAQADKLNITKIDPDLNKSPLLTLLSFPHPTGSVLHFVEQINATEYFDSELGNPIKPLNYNSAVVLSQHSIQLTTKFMELVENNGTYYVEGDLGYFGINGVEYLNLLLKIVSPDKIAHRPPKGPQLGVVETAPSGFIIKPQ